MREEVMQVIRTPPVGVPARGRRVSHSGGAGHFFARRRRALTEGVKGPPNAHC